MGNRLAHCPPRRPRHLHGYAVLGTNAVHRRHAHSSVDLVHRRRRRPTCASGNPGFLRLPHSRRHHPQSLPVLCYTNHSDVLFTLDRNGPRFLAVSRRQRLRQSATPRHQDRARLVHHQAEARRPAGANTLVAIRRLGKGLWLRLAASRCGWRLIHHHAAIC